MLTELTKFAVPDIDVNVIWPLLLVLLTGLVVMVADLVIGRRKETPLANLPAALGVAGLAFVLIFELFWFNKLGLATGYITTLSGMVLLDNYALFFNTIFLAAGIVSILIAWNYLHVEDIHTGEYYMLLIFAVFGMMIMASTTSLLMIFIGLEIMSIAVYVLAGMIRRQKKSTESALKYFLLGAFSTGFLLYGITGLYIATGSLDLRGIAAAGITGNFYAYLGLGFLIVGFGFKIAAVPFHMWTPDVYEGAPTSVTAFMAVAVKAAAFAAFLRVMLICFESLTGEWYYILYVLAILTMTYGNVVALAQKNIKRMLAYSSIAHAGYLLTAMVAATNPSARDMAVESVLYYLLVYTFMNLGAFGVVAYLSKKGRAGPQHRRLRGDGLPAPAGVFGDGDVPVLAGGDSAAGGVHGGNSTSSPR